MRVMPLCSVLVVVAPLLAVVGAGASGCGSTLVAAPDAPDGSAADSSVASDDGSPPPAPEASAPVPGYPAPHPTIAQATSGGGPVMTAPNIIAITFKSDPLQASIADFVSKFGAATTYWRGATAEYAVGPIAGATTIVLDETPPATISDDEIQTWLTAKIAGLSADGGADGGTALPPPDINAMYTIFYPTGVTVNFVGGASCDSYEGYHSDYQLADKRYVTYAVIPRCPPPAPGVSEIDSIAATTSHEFIEAATDPLANDMPAWNNVDPDHTAWEYGGGGGEIGDLCAPFPDSFYKPTGLPYLVQRVWSNAAASAGHDPCQPDGNSPYFNSAPVLNDTLNVADPGGNKFTTKGIKIGVGKTATVELDLYSDMPTTGPWSLQILDIASTFYGSPPELSFTLDKTSGQNGDKIQLTIKVLKAGQGGGSAFWIQNTLGATQTVWLGLVGN